MKTDLQEVTRQSRSRAVNVAKLPTFSEPPGYAEIARSAFFAWRRDGCPEGYDEKYWRDAEDALRMAHGVARPAVPAK